MGSRRISWAIFRTAQCQTRRIFQISPKQTSQICASSAEAQQTLMSRSRSKRLKVCLTFAILRRNSRCCQRKQVLLSEPTYGGDTHTEFSSFAMCLLFLTGMRAHEFSVSILVNTSHEQEPGDSLNAYS